jgi:glycosyltransferase involved in cell wall biosynthesis
LNIVFVNQFYPPDVAPTGQVLHDLAARMVQRGHAVRVLCSRAAYSGDAVYPQRDTLDGVEVLRVSAVGFGPKSHTRKIASYASFVVKVAAKLVTLRPRPDLVVCLTTPPYIGLLGRCIAGLRGHAHAHWIMDVYPDVMAAHGMLEEGSRSGSLFKRGLFRVLQHMTALEVGGRSQTITLGPDMAERVARYATRGRRAAAERVSWVPLWGNSSVSNGADASEAAELRAQRGWGTDQTVFLYSGNMGLGHRLEEFLQVALRMRADGADAAAAGRARFAFSGSGKRRHLVELFTKHYPDAPVELLPYAPREQLGSHLCSADVLLASLEPAWAGCMIPSKLQTIFSVGRPVLFVGPRNCSMASWIAEADAGWVIEPDDIDALMSAISEATVADRRAELGANAARYAREHFDMAANCDRICDVLEHTLTQRRPSR